MNTLAIQGEFSPFMFDQIRLKQACWIENEPYFTRRAIGEWLEYSPKIQDRAISKIIERNPHIDQFSSLVNLTSELDSGRGENHRYQREQSVRVYNPIGLQLIIFESHQPKAKIYKVMVAHLVYAFMRGELQPPKNISRTRLQFECEQVLRLPSGAIRGNAVKAICKRQNRSIACVYIWMKRIQQGENPAIDRRGIHRKGKILSMSAETVGHIKALVKENPGIMGKEIIERVPNCSSLGTIWRIKRQVKEQLAKSVTAWIGG